MSIAFDAHPVIYWLAGYAIALLLCGVIYGAVKVGAPVFEKSFLAVSGGLLVMMRLPILVFNRELNPDESQMLTQAMTLAKDPVYWRSVDGTTGGPLGSYFLIIPAKIVGAFNYVAAHAGALMLVFVTLATLYMALRNWGGKVVAMVGIYPVVLFYAFNQQEDFVHYSSEHLPVALMGLIALIMSRLHVNRNTSYQGAVMLGVLIALLPLGKLQTLPMVFVLVLWGLYTFWERGRILNEGAAFIAGGIGTLAFVAILVVLGNVFDDFLTYYIQGNFQYGGDQSSWISNLVNLPAGLAQTPPVVYFILPQIALVLAAIFLRQGKKLFKNQLFIFPALWIAFTLLAISRTGSGYYHYWLFSIVPIAIFTANYLVVFQVKPLVISAFSLFALGCCGLYPSQRLIQQESLNKYISGPGTNRGLPFTIVGQETAKYGRPGEYLAVWGWNCQFYIETQMPQGIAENHSIRSIFAHPMQDIYLNRYHDDLARNKPVVILDAVGKNSFWVQDKKTQGIENYPALSAYVRQNYSLVKTVDDTRLYVRKDRL